MNSIVSATGEVVIPAAVLDRCGLRPGDDVEIFVRGDAIVIKRLDRRGTA